MSKFGAVEASAGAQLATLVPGTFAQSRLVAAGMLAATRPDAWPCAFLSVLNAKKTSVNVIAGHTTIEWDVLAVVLVFANSDGQQLGDARGSAWTLMDAVIDTFLNFSPSGFAPGTSPMAPCIVGDPDNTLTDAGQACVFLPLIFKIQTIK